MCHNISLQTQQQHISTSFITQSQLIYLPGLQSNWTTFLHPTTAASVFVDSLLSNTIKRLVPLQTCMHICIIRAFLIHLCFYDSTNCAQEKILDKLDLVCGLFVDTKCLNTYSNICVFFTVIMSGSCCFCCCYFVSRDLQCPRITHLFLEDITGSC